MDYLQEKLLLLDSILQNTQAQQKAIEDDDIGVLAELINKRQTMMNQVDKLDKETANMADNMTSEQEEPIENLLSQIVTIDNNNQSIMRKELVNVQGELLKIRTGRKQEANYANEYGLYKEEGIFFDTKE